MNPPATLPPTSLPRRASAGGIHRAAYPATVNILCCFAGAARAALPLVNSHLSSPARPCDRLTGYDWIPIGKSPMGLDLTARGQVLGAAPMSVLSPQGDDAKSFSIARSAAVAGMGPPDPRLGVNL